MKIYYFRVKTDKPIHFSDRNIRVFVFGDYEFLCAIYGITGAIGNNI